MVKQINIFFDDDEHKKILKAKGNMTWKDFMVLFSELAADKNFEKLIEKKRNEKEHDNNS